MQSQIITWLAKALGIKCWDLGEINRISVLEGERTLFIDCKAIDDAWKLWDARGELIRETQLTISISLNGRTIDRSTRMDTTRSSFARKNPELFCSFASLCTVSVHELSAEGFPILDIQPLFDNPAILYNPQNIPLPDLLRQMRGQTLTNPSSDALERKLWVLRSAAEHGSATASYSMQWNGFTWNKELICFRTGDGELLLQVKHKTGEEWQRTCWLNHLETPSQYRAALR